MYQSQRLVDARGDSTALIGALFERFMKHPEMLPVNYLEESAGEPLHRQVCDYIAGMTDGFLLKTCAQMKLL